jgi:Uma2 family endonuclease
MSQSAATALAPLPFELVYDDGEPMENFKHVCQMFLLLDSISAAMTERGRSDFFAGGNMFVYYSIDQAREVAMAVAARRRTYFRGPDVFLVDGVRGGMRMAWVSWEEGGRLPDLIVELLSPSTEEVDRGPKMDLYARVFRTKDYFLCDPDERKLEGFRLVDGGYQPVLAGRQGRVPSVVLGLELGLWDGVVKLPGDSAPEEGTWLRLFRPDGRLIPTSLEAAEARVEAERARAEAEHTRAEAEHTRAEAERARAEAERARAEAAEAELARLRSLLGDRTPS